MIDEFGDSLELELREPIKVGTLEISTLTLTEPTGEQLAASYKQAVPVEALMTLIAMNAGVSPAFTKKMKQRDLARADAFFSHFGEPSTSEPSESSPQS